MPSVNIQGVGVVNFPEDMSREDIAKAIEKDILPKYAKKPEPYAGPTKFEAKVAPQEPSIVDRVTSAIKELVSGPGSVMDKEPAGTPAPDRRLELGQGPISQETLRKAQDIREGVAKPQEQSAVVQRTAAALEAKKAPTVRGLVDRAMEPERIVEEAESQRRKQFAKEQPLVSSLQSGLASTLAGNINIPSVTADLFNQTFINPILTASGLDPLPKTPLAYGTEYLGKIAQDYMPEVGKQKLGEAFDKRQATDWLFSNLAANSPQMLMSLAGAYAPALRATILPAMGGTAAGQSYVAGDDSRIAAAKGAVEVLTEMLPLGVFDKVGDLLKNVSAPKQRTILAVAGQRLVKTGADITAISLTNAIEEAAAQFGGNVLDKYFGGKDVELTEGLLEASVLGAASGTAMTAPRAIGTLAGRGEPLTPEQQIAQQIETGVAQAQPVGVNEAAIRALNPQTYDQTIVTPQQTVNRSAQIDALSQATSVDEAVTAAANLAGTIEGARSYAPPQAPAAATPLAGTTPTFGGLPIAPTVGGVTPQAEPVTAAPELVTPETVAVTPLAETQQVTLPEPDVAIEQQFGLDKLRQAPRPQRIQGTAVADLSDDDLRAVVEDDKAPAITRRGAQIELDARAKEAAPAAVTQAAAPVTTEVSRETTENFIDIPADASTAALPNADAEPVGGVAAADRARAIAQEAIDRWAAAENRTDAPVLNPAPAEEDAAVNQIAQALNSQLGGKVYAYHDTQPDAVNGFALGGTGFVNTSAPIINVAKTSLHEFKHTVEQIAEAEARQGLTNTPAQQFTASIDSIFTDMTEEGKRAYAENFLHKEELDAIADPAAREQRLQELLQEPELVSEMTADFLGNRATDKEFWQDLAARDPSGFKGFVDRWFKIIDNLLARLRGSDAQVTGESAKVDQYVRDLKKAKMVAREALIAYRRGTLQQMPAAAGTPAMSLREGEGREANIPGRGEGVQPSPERAGPAAGEAGRGEVPSYGEAREGAISVVGRHYSPRVQTRLNSAYYGTGLRGAEAGRLRESKDFRIGNRIYFYVDTGNGIRPESGVGRFAHEVRLNNIYDPATRLIPPQGNSNAFESAVIDAGFDGYIAPFGRGAAVVLLGPKHDAVPVKSLEQPALSKRESVSASREELRVGNVMFSARQRNLVSIPTVTVQDLVDKKVMGIKADLTDAGISYTGIDGSLLEFPIEMLGGPNFVRLPENIANNVVWAVRGGATLSKILEKIKNVDYILVHAMNSDSHLTNATISQAYIQTVKAYLRDKRISQDNLLALDEIVRSPNNKNSLPDFPGFEAPNILAYIDGLSFDQRGALAKILEKKEAQIHGLPNLDRFRRETLDPEYAGYRQGDTMLVIEIDKSNPTVRLGEQGTKLHPSYPLGLRGKVIGKLAKGVNYELIYKDYFEKKVPLLKNGKTGAWYAFDRILPVQKITEEIAASVSAGGYKTLSSSRQAQAALAIANNQWLESGKTKALGGVSITEFTDALKANEGAAALTLYTPNEVKAGIKDGSFKIYQLGKQGGDKGLQIFFGLKQGTPWYKDMIEGVGDQEVEIVSVTNNEPGAPGIASSAIMTKAIAEGATILDAFAVKSPRFPNGFLPELYGQFGFETIGTIPFDPSYYDANQMADLKAFWSKGGWKEADGYPDVVVMRWKGKDEDRRSTIERYVRTGETGVPGEAARFDGSPTADAHGQRNKPSAKQRRAEGADRGTAGGDQGVSNTAPVVRRAYSSLQELAQLSPGDIRNLGLDPTDVAQFRDQLATGAAPEQVSLSKRKVQEVSPTGLESLFEGLNGRGLKRTRAQAAVNARPDAARLNYVQENFLDILSELEDSGKVKINCD